MKRGCILAAILIGHLFPGANAGGPLVVAGGSPLVWDTDDPISYQIDRGALSGAIDAAESAAMVRSSFDEWSNVATATITFNNDGLLPINVSTAAQYIPYDNFDDATNAVVLDEGGNIIRQLLGPGQEFSILGWAAPFKATGSGNPRLVGFVSLMNGRLATSRSDFESTVVHEFGHSVGLDHSQINVQFVGNGIANDDIHIPTMYPTSSDDNDALARLNPDDIAWIAKLYPNDQFDQNFGHISGRVVRSDGSPVLGANVVAVRQDSQLMHIYSCVSDFQVDGTGAFEIPVSPGEYRLRIEPIRPSFVGGSSVGPHAEKSSSASFQNVIQTKIFNEDLIVAAGSTVDAGDLVAD